MIELILDIVKRLVQHHVDRGFVINVPLAIYASSLTLAYYAERKCQSAGGTVAFTEGISTAES